MRRLRHLFAISVIVGVLAYVALLVLDWRYPPDLTRYNDQSIVVTDRTGQWLRIYLSKDNKRRIATRVNDLPDDYLQLLINYEDGDFYRHNGVDFSAIIRATWQNLRAGETVSGASTLSMQTAKLLQPRPRTLKSKLIEAFRAWQLERRFSKDHILDMYVTLAPVGGNLEGLTAAAHYYFNKPAKQLSLAESAWLVALPQSPTRLSVDDRAAVNARNKVLKRALDKHIIDPTRYRQAIAEPLKLTRTPFPLLAPHITARAKQQTTPTQRFYRQTTLDKPLQTALLQALQAQLPLQHPKSNLAAAIMDNHSGQWRAYVGSADFFSVARHGQLDMLSAVRSPGSALKPFITLFAFDWLHYQPQTTIDDTPINGSAYRPSNYDGQYLGRITLAEALMRSRNVPAVRLLAAIKADYFADALYKNGLLLYFPSGGKANLSLALGGVGIRGKALAKLYRKLANCRFNNSQTASSLAAYTACWQVTAILQQSSDGQGRVYFGREPVAMKTGTAYGWRDRWLFAYTRDYTLVLWSGRADGQFAEQRASAEALIPLLRRVIALLPNPPQHYRASPKPDMIVGQQLPPRLRHVGESLQASQTMQTMQTMQTIQTKHAENIEMVNLNATNQQNRLRIVAPLSGGVIDYREGMALNFSLRGGRPPFMYWINGDLLMQSPNYVETYINPQPGSYHLSVIDADGQTADSHFRLLKQSVKPPVKRAVLQRQ